MTFAATNDGERQLEILYPLCTYIKLSRSRREITIDFLEHPVHVLEVIMIQEPYTFVLVILVKGYCT